MPGSPEGTATIVIYFEEKINSPDPEVAAKLQIRRHILYTKYTFFCCFLRVRLTNLQIVRVCPKLIKIFFLKIDINI